MGLLVTSTIVAPAALAEESAPAPAGNEPDAVETDQSEPAPVLTTEPTPAATLAVGTGAHFGTGKLTLALEAGDDGAPADAVVDPTGAQVRVHFDVLEGSAADVTGTCTLVSDGWCSVPPTSPLPAQSSPFNYAVIPAESQFTLTLVGAPTSGALMVAGATVTTGYSDTTPGPSGIGFMTEALGTVVAPGAYRTLGVALSGTGSMAGATFSLGGETVTTDEAGTATFTTRYLPDVHEITQTTGPGGRAVSTKHSLTVAAATSVLERSTPVRLSLTGVVGPALPEPTPKPTPKPTPTPTPEAPVTPPAASPSPAPAVVAEPSIAPGRTQTVTLSGFGPGEEVRGVLHSTPVDLGTVTADAQGRATFTFTIPAGLESGVHDVTMTGLSSGFSASVEFAVTSAPGSERLAYTGADVAPLLGLGGLLVAAGGAVLVASRRRRA